MFTERVKIENPKALNLALQKCKFVISRKNYNAGMCDVIYVSLFQALSSWGRAKTSEEKTRED